MIEIFVFVILFWLFCDKFHCNFFFGLEFFLYVIRSLMLGFLRDENDLHHEYNGK